MNSYSLNPTYSADLLPHYNTKAGNKSGLGTGKSTVALHKVGLLFVSAGRE